MKLFKCDNIQDNVTTKQFHFGKSLSKAAFLPQSCIDPKPDIVQL